MKKYILDACALLAFLRKEDGSEIVKDIIIGDDEVFLHSVNFLEVYYNLLREFGKDKSEFICEEILELPIKIIQNTNLLLIKAASYFKTNYKISLGDSIVLGAAKLNSASIVTSDRHEFSAVENREPDLNFHWIR